MNENPNNRQFMEIMRANKSFRNADEVMLFSRAAQQLDMSDNSLLPEILYFFEDEFIESKALEYLEFTMYSLDDEMLVRHLVVETSKLIEKSENWIRIYYGVPLTDEQLRNVLIEELHKLSDNEVSIILELFDKMQLECNPNDEFGAQLMDGILKVNIHLL